MLRGSLSRRILLVAVGLVTITAVAVGLATVQFARTAARAEQRGELTAQASLLTLQSVKLVTQPALRRVAKGLDGTTLSVYDAAGSLRATTAAARNGPLVRRTRAAAVRAEAGTFVSTQIHLPGGKTVLVEARPTSDGGAIVLTRRLTVFTRTSIDLLAGILITLGICLALAVAAAVWLSRRIARPLAATAGAARRLARGERGVPVPDASPAEVGDVADALRTLDRALVTSEGRQREFLLSISHELRTPLTALRGYGEALADGIVPPGDVATVGGTLVAETTRLDRFVADLLELARMEAEDFGISPARVPLLEIARETVDAWRGRADTAGVALSTSGFDADGGPVALADPRRVRQVLDGLVENALRATPTGGTIAILGVRADAWSGVAVEDSGPGLSDEDLADAFTRGVLRERYRESRAVGTGLGLSIAARLAARMGGRVTAGRAQAHGGARFTLELPPA
jgi:two-component system, OmpR family, sensor kinase